LTQTNSPFRSSRKITKFSNFFRGELIEEYESVWEIEKESLAKKLERAVGHSLVLKDSTLDHHEAGRGVFLSCRR
jgi:hypothetical protein